MSYICDTDGEWGGTNLRVIIHDDDDSGYSGMSSRPWSMSFDSAQAVAVNNPPRRQTRSGSWCGESSGSDDAIVIPPHGYSPPQPPTEHQMSPTTVMSTAPLPPPSSLVGIASHDTAQPAASRRSTIHFNPLEFGLGSSSTTLEDVYVVCFHIPLPPLPPSLLLHTRLACCKTRLCTQL